MLVTKSCLVVGLVIIMIVVGLISGHCFGFRFNKTRSFPLGLYQIKKVSGSDVQRGHMVVACPQPTELQLEARKRGYLSWGLACPGYFMPLIKVVAAVSGDVVKVSQAGVSVNNELITNSGLLEKDGQGRSLPSSLSLSASGKVPSGKIWLLSDYSHRSWDSRYFGPVPIDTVYGLARPVFTFGQR